MKITESQLREMIHEVIAPKRNVSSALNREQLSMAKQILSMIDAGLPDAANLEHAFFVLDSLADPAVTQRVEAEFAKHNIFVTEQGEILIHPRRRAAKLVSDDATIKIVMRALKSTGGIDEIRKVTLRNPQSIDYLRDARSIEQVHIIHAAGITDWSPLGDLKNLKELRIHDAPTITDLSQLAPYIRSVKYLGFWGAPLETLDGLETLPNLTSLFAMRVPKLRSIDALADCDSLKTIEIFGVSPSLNLAKYGSSVASISAVGKDAISRVKAAILRDQALLGR